MPKPRSVQNLFYGRNPGPLWGGAGKRERLQYRALKAMQRQKKQAPASFGEVVRVARRFENDEYGRLEWMLQDVNQVFLRNAFRGGCKRFMWQVILQPKVTKESVEHGRFWLSVGIGLGNEWTGFKKYDESINAAKTIFGNEWKAKTIEYIKEAKEQLKKEMDTKLLKYCNDDASTKYPAATRALAHKLKGTARAVIMHLNNLEKEMETA